MNKSAWQNLPPTFFVWMSEKIFLGIDVEQLQSAEALSTELSYSRRCSEMTNHLRVGLEHEPLSFERSLIFYDLSQRHR